MKKLLPLFAILLTACATTSERRVASSGEGLCMSQNKNSYSVCKDVSEGEGSCMAGGNSYSSCKGL
ncbi:MAG: hypothetical protein ACXWQO_15285 [Bdellovibrionota bacterium]